MAARKAAQATQASRSEPGPAVASDPVLPHNLEAEKAVLGALLLNGATLDLVRPTLQARDFYRKAHGRIYAAVLAVVDDRREEVDLLTVKAELKRRGQLDDVGGPAYIASLVDGVPRTMHAEHYARLVREAAVLRELAIAADGISKRAYAAADPAADILRDADRALLELARGARGDRLTAMADRAGALMDEMESRVKLRGQLSGLDTGFASVNEATFGWQRTDLIVVAARPSIGKTTFVMNSVAAGAAKGAITAVFSLEMRRSQLELRLLSSVSGIPMSRLKGGYLLETDWPKFAQAVNTIHALPIWIDDRAAVTVWDVRSACRRLKADLGRLDLVVIDYVQLIPGTLDYRASRNEQVTDISRQLKRLADELDVPIILLSQLSRANEKRNDPRPKLSDLRESGALEQDADLVCFLHRRNHREGGVTQFIIEKQRNGPTGTFNLTLDLDTVTFTDGGEDPPEPERKPRRAKKVEPPKLADDF